MGPTLNITQEIAKIRDVELVIAIESQRKWEKRKCHLTERTAIEGKQHVATFEIGCSNIKWRQNRKELVMTKGQATIVHRRWDKDNSPSQNASHKVFPHCSCAKSKLWLLQVVTAFLGSIAHSVYEPACLGTLSLSINTTPFSPSLNPVLSITSSSEGKKPPWFGDGHFPHPLLLVYLLLWGSLRYYDTAQGAYLPINRKQLSFEQTQLLTEDPRLLE